MVVVLVASCVWLFVTLWTIICRFLCPWNSPGKNTGMDSHALFQGGLLDPGIKPGSPALQACSTIRATRGLGLNVTEEGASQAPGLRVTKIPLATQASPTCNAFLSRCQMYLCPGNTQSAFWPEERLRCVKEGFVGRLHSKKKLECST